MKTKQPEHLHGDVDMGLSLLAGIAMFVGALILGVMLFLLAMGLHRRARIDKDD